MEKFFSLLTLNFLINIFCIKFNKFKEGILWNTILPAYLAGVTKNFTFGFESFIQNNKMIKNLIHVHNASP